MPVICLFCLLIAFPAVTCLAQTQASESADSAAIRTVDGNNVAVDTSVTRFSEKGHFKVTALSHNDPPELNNMHSWTVHVEDVNGNNVDAAVLTIEGGMPEHNHGLPTAPRVTSYLGAGDYLLEGMRFNMGGWWQLRFTIEAMAITDTVVFNRILAQ